MARIARVVAVGFPHHITQRGNNRQRVFQEDSDRKEYLNLIQSHSKKYQLEILAYCLMDNHVHFIGVPRKEDSLAKTFSFAHMRYSQYYNKKMGMSGHLWQGRFYSCVMDERHVYACAKYIERNPVRAGMVKKPWDWKWSSAGAHCGFREGDPLSVNKFFQYVDESKKSWGEFINEEDKPEDIKRIRKHTLAGLPVGQDRFVRKLERKLGRLLEVSPKGRPTKKI